MIVTLAPSPITGNNKAQSIWTPITIKHRVCESDNSKSLDESSIINETPKVQND